VTPDAFNLPE